MGWWKKLIGRQSNKSVAAPNPPSAATPQVAFQPHNDIERDLMDAANNPDLRPAFQRGLLDAQLYAATPTVPEASQIRQTQAGEQLSLLNVTGPDGTPITAIFTAQERIVEVFGMGVGFVGVRGQELLSMLAGHGAWLNPGFPYSLYWTADELSALLGLAVPRVVQRETQVMLGVPSNPPVALIDALRTKLASDDRIVEAWFALAHWPDEGASSWHLDIRTELPPEDVRHLLAETFRNAQNDGLPLDMVVNKPGDAGIGIRLVPPQTH